jgi:hypothetical protein
MRILKTLLSSISLCAIATPLYAQSAMTYGHITLTDATGDGVPEQVNTPQGLVVIANLVSNGVTVQLENRSWQRLTFSQANLDILCVAIPPTTGMYFLGDTLGITALETTQSVQKRIECRPNYTAANGNAYITGTFPTTARSAPLAPSNAHDNVTIADYSYDAIPVRVNEANNVQLEALVQNRTGEFRVRNNGSIPIRIDSLTATVSCGRTRPAGMYRWASGDREVTRVVESTPSNERWVAQGQTLTLTNSCPTGYLAKAATLVTHLD